jgi:hypothetical protein
MIEATAAPPFREGAGDGTKLDHGRCNDGISGGSLASFWGEAIELAHLTVSSADRYVPRAAGDSF